MDIIRTDDDHRVALAQDKHPETPHQPLDLVPGAAVYTQPMIQSFGDKHTKTLFNDEFVRRFEGFARAAKRKLEAVNTQVAWKT